MNHQEPGHLSIGLALALNQGTEAKTNGTAKEQKHVSKVHTAPGQKPVGYWIRLREPQAELLFAVFFAKTQAFSQ